MTNFLEFKWYRSILLTLFTFLICLGLNNLSLRLTQASNPPTSLSSQTVEVAETAWRYGSFPVENFQSYTSPFGYRLSPVDGQRQFHNGLDLAAPIGSYVRNWWSGKVIQVSDGGTCGTSVIVQSGAWQHAYCHMEGHVESSPKGSYLIDRSGGLQIWEGQEVAVGARIGRVGMTGRTTGPHLHWTLKYNGDYVDPALVLKEMFKQQA
jgi:murein DD-endopeptidase MepM/ murein hydrolase activator NlpD